MADQQGVFSWKYFMERLTDYIGACTSVVDPVEIRLKFIGITKKESYT